MLRITSSRAKAGLNVLCANRGFPSGSHTNINVCIKPCLKSKVETCALFSATSTDFLSSGRWYSTLQHSKNVCAASKGSSFHHPSWPAKPDHFAWCSIGNFSIQVHKHGRKLALLSDVQLRNSYSSQQRNEKDSALGPIWSHYKRFGAGSFIIAAVVVGCAIVFFLSRSRYNSNESGCEAEDARDAMKMVKQRRPGKSLSLQEAVEQATDLCQRLKDECGSPGLVVAVSVDGQLVWTQGLGYADVENRLPCKPESVMRIASISKSITMAAVAKAMENGDLDLDKPVQAYVPQFPEKTVNGEKVTVTTRQLVSHLSGVRHYSKDYFKTKDTAKDNALSATTTAPSSPAAEKKNPSETLAVTDEFLLEEYYIKDKLDSTESALALFKDDPLVHKPDSKFLYTTHGWTLIAAVLEGATKRKFPDLIRLLISDLGLTSTYLDENEPLIYNRSRFYVRNKKHHLENAPYVDCAYKYAGGGMLSTVTDLVHFGNAMLYSYQYREAHGSQTAQKQDSNTAPPKDTNTTPQPRNAVKPTPGMHQPSSDLDSANHHGNLPGYLKPATMQQIWKPVEKTKHSKDKDNLYAMGWEVMPEKRKFGFGRSQPFYVYHTGAAIGASSVLLILPTSNSGEVGKGDDSVVTPLKGVTVAIITNLIKVSLTKTAFNVAKVFDQVSVD